MKREVAELFGEEYARLAVMLNDVRGWAKGTLPTYQDRKAFFEGIVNGEPDPIELLRAGDERRRARPDRRRAARTRAARRDRRSPTSTSRARRGWSTSAARTSRDRRAVARAVVRMAPETAAAVAAGDAPKGDVLGTARIAGIQAAKRTGELIPLCHPLGLDHVDVDAEVDADGGVVTIDGRGARHGRTGVEMEAMTAAAVAALTVYDMVKGIERGVAIERSSCSRSPAGAAATGAASAATLAADARPCVLTDLDARRRRAREAEDESGPLLAAAGRGGGRRRRGDGGRARRLRADRGPAAPLRRRRRARSSSRPAAPA